MRRLMLCVGLLCVLTAAASAQDAAPCAPARAEETRAYGMLRAREAAAQAELEKLLTAYTPAFPAVRSKQFELEVIARESARMLATEQGRLERLSAAYGELVLRRVALEIEVREALTKYTPRHPLVREKLTALSRAESEALEHLR
jgi:hypothetical protein